jgi:outer membrane protein assembly factor BamB
MNPLACQRPSARILSRRPLARRLPDGRRRAAHFAAFLQAALVGTACLSFLLGGGRARGGDWPQILGPDRNGVARDETLLPSWPPAGPRRLWSAPVGDGYAGPAVVGRQVVVFDREEGNERLRALSADTGKPQWQTEWPSKYRGGINPDKGPRCVPLVHKGRIYVFGPAGDLHCVELATGKKVWARELLADYAGNEGYFGAGSTPIVAGDKLLVNVGGRGDAGLVALALSDGKTVWKATDEGASYSSPTQAAADEVSGVAFVTRMNAVIVDPETGKVRAQFPFGKRGPTVNAAMPLQFDNFLFVTASYGIGAQLVRLEKGGPEIVWANDETLSSQYSTPVYYQGYFYGTHGREDVGIAEFRCVEAATGKVMWSERDFPVAHVILAGDKLLILNTQGQLVLAHANPRKFEKLTSAELVASTTRALPALSAGKLYLRTNHDGNRQPNELLCIEVGK